MQYLGESKNLFPQYMYIGTTSTNKGVSAIGLPNGMIRITGTSTARPQVTILYDRDYYLPAGTYSAISPNIPRGCNMAYGFTLVDGTRKTMYCTGSNKITLDKDVSKISLFFYGFVDPAIYTYDLVCPIMLVNYDGYYSGEYLQYLDGNPVQDIQRSKNLIPFPYTLNPVIGGVAHTINTDGSITLKGTRTGNAYLGLYGGYAAAKVPVTSLLEVGKTYSISGNSGLVRVIIFLYPETGGGRNVSNGSFTVLETDKYIGIFLYIPTANATVDETIYPMLNEGTTALPYQPYLQRYDMYMYDNLIKLPYYDGLSKTHNGITFTVDEKTGWVTANGTSTGQSDFYIKATKSLYNSNVLYIPKGKYVAKSGVVGGSNSTYFLRFNPKDRTKQNYFDLDTVSTKIVDITYDDPDGWLCAIIIKTGAGTVNNLVFKPELIRLAGD